MEGREGISSGVTVIGAEAPSAYQMAPRSEAPNQGPVPEAGGAAIGVSPVSVGIDGATIKKKRGRPRKYGPDGSVTTMALSPLPISSSAPFSNDFSTAKRGKPRGMEYKQSKKVVVDHLAPSTLVLFEDFFWGNRDAVEGVYSTKDYIFQFMGN